MIHVWAVKPAVNGTWTLTSGEVWAVTGFETAEDAHQWVANYLIEWSRMNMQHQAMMANMKEEQEQARMITVAPLLEPDKDSKPN